MSCLPASFSNFGNVLVVSSSTRPTGSSLYEGRVIYETDTDRTLYYNGTTWVPLLGRMGRSLGGSAAGVGTSFTTITSLGVTGVANRRYEITAYVVARQRVSSGLVSISITDNADVALTPQDAVMTLGIDAYGTLSLTWDDAPGAGSFTYKLRGKTSANTVDFSANSYLMVKDIGAA